MATSPNQAAYPVIWDSRHNPTFEVSDEGLTKREYFAGIALQGFINTGCVRNQTLFTKIKRLFGFFGGQTNNLYNYPAIVKSSVEIADLLIEELNK